MTPEACFSPASAAAISNDPWRSFPAIIRSIRHEIPGVATYDLQIVDESVRAAYRYRPGQFNMLYVPGLGESAISISGDPDHAESLLHTVRVAGNVTTALSRLAEGATIGIRGPFGSHWPIEECAGRHVILVAGGIGLAPLRPVIFELLTNRQRYQSVSLLIGARDPVSLLYPDDYKHWQAGGLDVAVTVDHTAAEWTGQIGMVTTLLDRMPVVDPAGTVLMTCGPEVMMWYTVQSALRRGLQSESMWLSLERNMNCAVGLCGHCQLGPQFVCKDGPVFRFDRVASIMKVGDL